MVNDLSTRQIGSKAEDLACQYLRKLGYLILDRNYLIKGGELDIVASKNNQICFFEVKARFSHEFGLPVESITPWKIKHLKKTALFYLQNKGEDAIKIGYHIHLIGIDYAKNPENPEIEFVEDIA